MLRMRSKAMGDAPVAVQARLFAGRKISLVLKMLAAGCLSSWLMPYQASAAEKQGPRLSEALGPTEPFASNPPGAVPDNQGAATGAQDGAGPWGVARLIREVVSANPRITAQTSAARSARYDVSAARWQYFASPSLQAETAGADRQLVASVTQPLVTFGRLDTDLRAAKSRAGYADARVSETSYQLAFRVLDLYVQFLGARRAADVMQDDVNRLTDLGALISRRVTSGASAPVDFNLVLTRIRQSENALLSLETRQANSLDALSELLGRPISADMLALPQADPQNSVLASVELNDILARTVAYSPPLKRAVQEVEIAQIDRQRAINSAKPTIFGRFEQRLDHGRYSSSSFPSTRALVGVQLGIGSGLSILDRANSAEAQAQSAKANRDALLADVRSAVMNDVETYRASQRIVQSLRANLQVQEETVVSYNRLFLAGKRSWLDVLNMVRDLTGSRRDLAEAEVQLLATGYRLQLQTGEMAW